MKLGGMYISYVTSVMGRSQGRGKGNSTQDNSLERRATLGGIQTNDALQSRQSALSQSYRTTELSDSGTARVKAC